MRDFPAFRRSALRYWERRRIIYNLALIPPSLFAYMFMVGLAYVGDPPETHYGLVAFWFALSALGAKICYSFAYALEFILGSGDPTSMWLSFGRRATFVGGVLFAMLLALIGGRNIAMIEYHEESKRARLALHSTEQPRASRHFERPLSESFRGQDPPGTPAVKLTVV